MRILTRYISKTIITFIFLVILLLLGIQALIEFTHEFPDIGTGNYGILQALEYVLLMIPSDIYQFFPMAGLLGTIIGLGLLASNSELIIMRSAGMSFLQITFAVLQAALILSVIMVIIGEVVAPFGQSVATVNKTIAISGGQTIVTRQGIWIRNHNNYVHIKKISSDSSLDSITRYQFDDSNKLQLASFAKKGVFQDGQWKFFDVIQTDFSATTTKSATFPEQEWGFNLSPKLIGLTSIDADQKSLPELLTYIRFSHQSGLNTKHYEVIFWQRIFQPLAALVMIVLAVPFIFGPLRSVTMGLRMLAGLMVGFGFYILNQFVGPMSVVYQFPPWLAALLPTIIFALVGGVVLAKSS